MNKKLCRKVTVLFSREFVLFRRGKGLPVKEFLNSLGEKYQDRFVLSETAFSCETLVFFEDLSAFTEEVSALVRKLFGADDSHKCYTLTFSEPAEEELKRAEDRLAEESALTDSEKEPEEEVSEGAEEVTPEVARRREEEDLQRLKRAREERRDQTMQRVEGLVGAEEFKKYCRETVKIAPFLKARGLENVYRRQVPIISVGEGEGLSTYLEILANLADALELTQDACRRQPFECRLFPAGDRNHTNPFEEAESALKKTTLRGAVICVDISEWMTDIRHRDFSRFLRLLEKDAGEHLIVLRVPFLEWSVLNELSRSVSDVLSVRLIPIPPLSREEILSYARRSLSRMAVGVEATDGAWKLFSRRVMQEKSDGRFYGLDTIQKLLREMLYLKFLNNPDTGVVTKITVKDLRGFCAEEADDHRSAEEQFLDYVGMQKIYNRVREIVSQILVSKANPGVAPPCLHMRFVGNPGTGKTTVARLLARMLAEKGVLRVGALVECMGRDLCGQYIGHTAPITSGYCRDAYGSVLFIDEAYSLYRDASPGSRDFGREAIDTLIAQMENHREDLVVIMAGYGNEMDQLMRANPGLESRMPYLIEFDNYTRDELYEIFMRFVNKSFVCDEGFRAAVRAYFDSLSDDVLQARNFSNARFARNLFERTWSKAAARVGKDPQKGLKLVAADFAAASSEREFDNLQKKPERRTIGF